MTRLKASPLLWHKKEKKGESTIQLQLIQIMVPLF